MRLFHRLFLIIFLVATLPVLFNAVWLFRYQQVTKKNILEVHKQIAEFYASAATENMKKLNEKLSFVLDLERAAQIGQLEQMKIVQMTIAAQPTFMLLSVLDSAGKEIIRSASDVHFPEYGFQSRSADAVFQEARQKKQVVMGPVHMVKGLPVMTLVYPLRGDQYVYLAVSFQDLWSRVQKQSVGSGGRVVLADSQGNFLPPFDQDAPRVEPGFLQGQFRKDSPGVLEGFSSSSGLLVGAFQKVPDMDWVVLTLQPQAEAYLAASQMMAWMLVGIILILTGAALASYFAAQKITLPVVHLNQGALRVAQNDFSGFVREEGWTEFQNLARSFNQMTKQLKAFSDLQVERILEEKSRIETLIYTIPDGIVMASFQGEVLYINNPALQMLGLPSQDVRRIRTNLQDMIKQDRLRQSLQTILEKRARFHETEIEIEDPFTHRARYYKARATLVSTTSKTESGVVLMMRDITAEKEIERMKDEFFQSITHDLRAPLFAIQGYLRLLEKSNAPSPKDKTYFNYIYRSCDKLAGLIQDILDMARLEAGRMKLIPALIDPVLFLDRIIVLFKPMALEKGIELLLKIQAKDHGTLQADERRLERVFTNLVSNALKFTPQGGRIAVELVSSDFQSFQFAVSDTGPGVPKDKIDFVFEKFKQLDVPQQKSGFGLGLTICKGIVELHGGRIWLESEVGKGSRFIFRVPRVQTAISQAGA